ncbi:MAG: TetR/AcrR family transcriptional regulator [Reyranella sp.]|uniref:TetR/AcrR family transcriptional regulator n=1 Tax=Reyranella sp. TaxID=1929291 RepID=UPI003D129310
MRSSTEITKRPRGRPRGFVIEEVLERVRTVFMEKGFAAASLDDLAAASGLNRPSLYAAFGDKEQLYIATLRFYGQKSLEGLDTILDGPGTIAQRLGRVYNAAIELYTAPPVRPGCMIVGTAAVESPTHPRIADVARELLVAIEARLERAFAGSDLPDRPSPANRARMAGAIMYAIAIRARLGADAGELRAFAASMVPTICGAAASRKASAGGR